MEHSIPDRELLGVPLVLHDYWRSSAAYRVRIALNLKGIEYRQVPVDLTTGAHREAPYREWNPQGLVPALETGSGCLTQSLAICEYLEEVYPDPTLLPGDRADRARIRAIAQAIACEIHPLNNLRVLDHLVGECGFSEQWKLAWYRHWIAEGLQGVESMLSSGEGGGNYCLGDTPTLADVCLVPQLYNARRFGCPLEKFPAVMRIEETCAVLPAFQRARPEAQPDAK